MTRFFRHSLVALPLCSVLAATGGLADDGAPAVNRDSAEGIAQAMDACSTVVAAHDYGAEGQAVDFGWDVITTRSASVGLQDDPVRIVANVWKKPGGDGGNSSCGFLFDDQNLAQASVDIFTADREVRTDENGNEVVCFGDTFLVLRFEGPESVISKAMNAQAHVELFKGGFDGANPCT